MMRMIHMILLLVLGMGVVYTLPAEAQEVLPHHQRSVKGALQTRSGYQVLIELASLVAVSPEHVTEHRTYGSVLTTLQDTAALSQAAVIRSGAEQPADTFAQVKY